MNVYMCIFFCLFTSLAISQDSITFNPLVVLDANPVESQGKTGTCWSYATVSFLESELIRLEKGKYDLSEMFVARNVYLEKADNFVRRHGKTNFGEGSLSHDLINTIEKYGLMPNEAFNGLVSNLDKHDHAELAGLLGGYLKILTTQKKLSNLWKDGYISLLDVYLGKVPDSFEFKGKVYTSLEFAEYLGIDPDDYVNLTSFTHHPFYKEFVLEVPDNWSNGEFINIPIDEMVEIATNAIKKGFSIAWDTDVSNDEFDSKKGVASVDSEVNQDLRQLNFDNYTVTDDHLMHITGLAEGSDGLMYFLVKNSWGDSRGMEDYKGHIWVSENYFKLNTISIMLHKDALSREQLKKIKMFIE